MQRNLVELVRSRAVSAATRAYRVVDKNGETEDVLTYSGLDRACRLIATAIQAEDVRAGSRALLIYRSKIRFIEAFWACIYAGIIAVPAPPPSPARPERAAARLQSIAGDCKPDLVLTDGCATQDELAKWTSCGAASVAAIDTTQLGGGIDAWREPSLDRRSIAVLQYTSGSTGSPKGVVVTHGNFLHNLAMLAAFHGRCDDMVMVHWLPLFHDMGLIRGMMSPLHMGGDCIMMDPSDFVQRPYRWLAAASRYRATSIGAPNFGYELCNRKIRDTDLDSLDLSSVRMAFCSAEPIRAATIERFIERFGRSGLSRSAFRPSYGLAEATVMVCGEMGGRGPRIRQCDREALQRGLFNEADPSLTRTVPAVSSGAPLGGQEVAIVGAAGTRAAANEIGEIWLRGASVAAGYWQNPAATAEVFNARIADGAGPYLRTGDLGWLSPEGELFVMGRCKDLIIVRGQNYYPQDIEVAVEAATTDVRAGCIAAFSMETALGESVALVCELAPDAAGAPDAWPRVVAKIRAAASQQLELALCAVAFVERGTIPKTASGKVQRSRARTEFLGGALELLHLWTAPQDDLQVLGPHLGRIA